MSFLNSTSVFDNTQYVHSTFSQVHTFKHSVLSSFHVDQELNNNVEQIVPIIRAIMNLSIAYKIELGSQGICEQNSTFGLIVNFINGLFGSLFIANYNIPIEERAAAWLRQRHKLRIEICAKQVEDYGGVCWKMFIPLKTMVRISTIPSVIG